MNICAIGSRYTKVICINFLLFGLLSHAADDSFPLSANAQKTLIKDVYTEALAGSSPDNSFAILTSVIDSSKKSIRLSAYMLRSVFISDHLVDAAKRGVKVKILLDGWTVGRPKAQKIDLQELHNADRIVRAGGKVTYLASDRGQRDDRRFKYLHSKYLVIDDEILYVSSENFANNGHSSTRTIGNRGWVIAVKNTELAAMYAKVFDIDTKKVKKYNDLINYGESPDYTLKDKSFTPERTESHGTYRPQNAVLVKERMTLERVLSPDDAIATNRAIIGAVKKAKETLLIQNLSFAPHWGKEEDTAKTNPSLIAEAVLAAARRGISVKVMVNPMFFFNSNTPPKKQAPKAAFATSSILLPYDFNDIEENPGNLGSLIEGAIGSFVSSQKGSSRDNDALIKYFRSIAKKESLDLQASQFWIEQDGIRLLHNKGMIVDGSKTLISSINWGENSMKNNREVGLLVTSKNVANYYSDLFDRDWKYFRNTK